VYKIFTGKPIGKQLLGKGKRLENTGSIKMEFHILENLEKIT
jgi:hypothetical protein